MLLDGTWREQQGRVRLAWERLRKLSPVGCRTVEAIWSLAGGRAVHVEVVYFLRTTKHRGDRTPGLLVVVDVAYFLRHKDASAGVDLAIVAVTYRHSSLHFKT